MSKFDQLYRKIILTRFFTKGWGNPENLKRILDFRRNITNRDECSKLVPRDYPVHIDKDEVHGEVRIMEGHFLSPFTQYLPGIMPKEVEKANFQVILPKKWKSELKPICLQLAGTGDHYFWRRRTLTARPLLKEGGIGSIILENPYYGARKPKYQVRSSLQNVSDLFVMGGALVLESFVLFNWCERQGLGPLGITGISMGGHMASLAASNWYKPIVLVPCLSGSTASGVFTQGVMSDSIPWDVLRSQYYGDAIYAEEIKQLITSPHKKQLHAAYTLGKDLVKNFPGSIDKMKTVQETKDSEQYIVRRKEEKATDISDATVMRKEDKMADFNGDLDNKSSESEHYVVRRKEERVAELSSALENNSAKTNPNFDIENSQSEFVTQTLESKSDIVKDKSNLLDKTGLHNIINKDIVNNIINKDIVKKLNSKLPKLQFNRNKPKIIKSKRLSSRNVQTLEQDVMSFMTGVMDECTHLANFPTPVDTGLIIIVTAKQDAYVPRGSVPSLEELWPGAEVRYIDSGHVAAFLFQQDVFRRAIIDAFDIQLKKYYS